MQKVYEDKPEFKDITEWKDVPNEDLLENDKYLAFLEQTAKEEGKTIDYLDNPIGAIAYYTEKAQAVIKAGAVKQIE